MNNLEVSLSDLGLTQNESKVYLFLLRKGPSTILSISKYTKINRSTVHMVVGSLLDKRLVSEIKKTNRRHIVAEDPERFRSLIEQQELEVKRRKSNVLNLISSIHASVNNLKETTFADIRVFEGIENCRRLYDFVLTSKEVYSYVNSVFTADLFPENVQKFQAALEGGLVLKDIIINGKIMNEFVRSMLKYPTYSCKFLKCEDNFDVLDYMITAKGIALVYEEGKDINGLVIYSKPIIQTSISLFKTMWEVIPPPNFSL